MLLESISNINLRLWGRIIFPVFSIFLYALFGWEGQFVVYLVGISVYIFLWFFILISIVDGQQNAIETAEDIAYYDQFFSMDWERWIIIVVEVGIAVFVMFVLERYWIPGLLLIGSIIRTATLAQVSPVKHQPN